MVNSYCDRIYRIYIKLFAGKCSDLALLSTHHALKYTKPFVFFFYFFFLIPIYSWKCPVKGINKNILPSNSEPTSNADFVDFPHKKLQFWYKKDRPTKRLTANIRFVPSHLWPLEIAQFKQWTRWTHTSNALNVNITIHIKSNTEMNISIHILHMKEYCHLCFQHILNGFIVTSTLFDTLYGFVAFWLRQYAESQLWSKLMKCSSTNSHLNGHFVRICICECDTNDTNARISILSLC